MRNGNEAVRQSMDCQSVLTIRLLSKKAASAAFFDFHCIANFPAMSNDLFRRKNCFSVACGVIAIFGIGE